MLPVLGTLVTALGTFVTSREHW